MTHQDMPNPSNPGAIIELGWIPKLRDEIGRVIVAQNYLIDRLIVGLLASGHVLLEGVPGLARL